jgi:hypothetical protein
VEPALQIVIETMAKTSPGRMDAMPLPFLFPGDESKWVKTFELPFKIYINVIKVH